MPTVGTKTIFLYFKAVSTSQISFLNASADVVDNKAASMFTSIVLHIWGFLPQL